MTDSPADDLPPRLQEFQDEVDKLKVTGRAANPERLGMTAGIVLFVAAIVIEIVAFNGSSSASDSRDQTDFVILALLGVVVALGAVALVRSLRTHPLVPLLARPSHPRRPPADRSHRRRTRGRLTLVPAARRGGGDRDARCGLRWLGRHRRRQHPRRRRAHHRVGPCGNPGPAGGRLLHGTRRRGVGVDRHRRAVCPAPRCAGHRPHRDARCRRLPRSRGGHRGFVDRLRRCALRGPRRQPGGRRGPVRIRARGAVLGRGATATSSASSRQPATVSSKATCSRSAERRQRGPRGRGGRATLGAALGSSNG